MRIVFRWLNVPEQTNVFNAVRKMVLASGLKFEPAKINKNWPRLAYGPAPATGQRAEREYLDIYLQEPVAAEVARTALEASAPKGLELLQVERVPYPLPSVQNLAAAVRYRVEGDFSRFTLAGRELKEFVESGKAVVVRRADNGLSCTTDILPFWVSADTLSKTQISLTLQKAGEKWMRPEWVVAAWLGIEIPAQADAPILEDFRFIRESFFWRDSQGELHPI